MGKAKTLSPHMMAGELRLMAEEHPIFALRGIRKAGKILRDEYLPAAIDATKPSPPIDTGDYKAGWKIGNQPAGISVYNDTPQAFWIEEGRRPGGSIRFLMKALWGWAARKYMTRTQLYFVARKISEQGYKPRWVLRRAIAAWEPIVVETIIQELAGTND